MMPRRLLLTFALQLAIVYSPMLNAIFRTEPLAPAELAYCLGVSSLVFVGVEIEKWAVRRAWLYRPQTARD